MTIKKLTLFAMLIAVVYCVSTNQAQARVPVERCMLDEHTPLNVVPYVVDEDFGLGAYRRLKGARVYIAVKPGVTARELANRMRREFERPRRGQLAEQCRPNVRQVDVSVDPVDTGFWIELTAPDERSAQSLLRWARRGMPVKHLPGTSRAPS